MRDEATGGAAQALNLDHERRLLELEHWRDLTVTPQLQEHELELSRWVPVVDGLVTSKKIADGVAAELRSRLRRWHKVAAFVFAVPIAIGGAATAIAAVITVARLLGN